MSIFIKSHLSTGIVALMRSILLVVSFAGLAEAKPFASGLFCESFPDAQSCAGSAIACTFCHDQAPPELNPFGSAFLEGTRQLGGYPDDVEAMQALIAAIGEEDPDGDGRSVTDEIRDGTLPGKVDVLNSSPCGSGSSCTFDPVVAYKKIWLSVCGVPPDFKDFEKFSALDREGQTEELKDVLKDCLDSEHWLGKDGVIWNIAHYKIRPVGSVKLGEDAGIIPIVDYYADYHLFIYSQIDGHDAREQLRADYTVSRDVTGGRTRYTKVAPSRLQDGQVMQPERRVGLLTTFWNLGFYLNYTPIARVLVAQAFNAYLGIDLSIMQGLNPPPIEESRFADYDRKGVGRPECAVCHTTLDPLAYPFRNYNGLTGTLQAINGQNAEALSDIANLGDEESLTPLSYSLPRMAYMEERYPGISAMPEAGYIFGKRVEDLHEWAEVLMSSDAFARNTVLDYWLVLIGHPPLPGQADEFDRLWLDFSSKHEYDVEAMLQDMIFTRSFGSL